MKPVLAPSSLVLLLGSCVGAFFGCRSQGSEAVRSPVEATEVVPSEPSEPARAPVAVEVARLPAGSLGPRVVATSEGWVSIAAARGDEGLEWRWQAAYVPQGVFSSTAEASIESPDASGRATGAVISPLGAARGGLRNFSLARTVSGGAAILSVHGAAEGEQLDVRLLGPSGEVRAESRRLAASPVPIVWQRLLPLAAGAEPGTEGLCLWAERHDRSADLYAAAVFRSTTSEPQLLAREVSAWQATMWQGQAYLVLNRRLGDRSRIELVHVGARGELMDEPTLVADLASGGYDVDFSAERERLRIVWTGGAVEPRLWSASMSASGVLGEPAPLTSPRLTQGLVRTIPSSDASARALLAWTEPELARGTPPPVLVGQVDRIGSSKLLSVAHRGHDPLLPDFAQHGGRVWGVFEGKSCEDDAPCERADLFALVSDEQAVGVRSLTQVLSEAAGSARRAAMAWDLSCGERDRPCVALVADAGSPATVYLVALRDLTYTEASLARLTRQPVRMVQRLAGVPELSSLITWSDSAGQASIAWLSFFDPSEPYRTPARPAPDGRRAPLRARLEVQSRSPWTMTEGEPPASDSWVVSYRARSLGGLAFAPEASGSRAGALAWAAIDGSEPQLFATLIDDNGKKQRQRMLTRQKGEVTDVAVARVTDGWLFSWVGGPSGSEEVFVLRVDDRLSGGAPVQVTSGAVSPTGLSLVARGSELVLAWADARRASQTGRGDLYVARVDAWGRPTSPPKQVAAGASHLHSPRLAVLPGAGRSSLLLAFIEARDAGSVADPGLATTADLVSGGRGQVKLLDLDGEEEPVVIGPGSTGSFDFRCSETSCQFVGATTAAEVGSELWLGRWQSDGKVTVQPFVRLGTSLAEASLPRFSGEGVLYADQATERESGEAQWELRFATPAVPLAVGGPTDTDSR